MMMMIKEDKGIIFLFLFLHQVVHARTRRCYTARGCGWLMIAVAGRTYSEMEIMVLLVN